MKQIQFEFLKKGDKILLKNKNFDEILYVEVMVKLSSKMIGTSGESPFKLLYILESTYRNRYKELPTEIDWVTSDEFFVETEEDEFEKMIMLEKL